MPDRGIADFGGLTAGALTLGAVCGGAAAFGGGGAVEVLGTALGASGRTPAIFINSSTNDVIGSLMP